MSLYVKETGPATAPTIVFLHGIATTGWMWQQQTAELAEYHCLAVDLPGHGRSNQQSWPSLAVVATQVADLIRAQVPAGRAHLVGLSLGAYVVAQLLNDTPEVVDHAILSGVTVLPHPQLRLMKLLGPLLARLIKRDFMLKMNEKMLKIPEGQHAAYRQQARLTSPRGYLQASNSVAEFRLPPRLAMATSPTLIVAGEHEHPLILKSLPLLVAALPNAEGRIVAGMGHGWNGEAPALFSTMIRNWITDAPLPDALRHLVQPAMA